MDDIRIKSEELKALLPQCMLRDWIKIGMRLARLLARPHPRAAQHSNLDRLLGEAKASIRFREHRRQRRPLPDYPDSLPIARRREELIEAIQRHQVLVVAGETGSGKTTQIPKMCLDAGLGIEARIGCTQPRRVAALSVSRRIAEELRVPWGREVGCKIRFSDETSPETYIKMMTDGVLLAETQSDPNLSEYNAIIIDEAHERSLNIDFLLGYLQLLLQRRSDLKLIITSATIDTEAFSAAFGYAPVFEVSGRLYPVEVEYAPLDAAAAESGDRTYIDAAADQAEAIHRQSGRGDILIFMPSERDIRETRELIQKRCGSSAEIIPLFGRLSHSEQQRVFQSSPGRKVVIATNIAETSLTIPGIRYVIDTGLARMSRYSPRTRTKRLPIEAISQSSADQRKGRSGRMENGICIRLYSEEDFEARPRYTQPEIQRANLAEVILRMKAFHLGDIESFPFINPPQPQAIRGGYQLLQELGALDREGTLTALGFDLARLPVDPTIGRMILEAEKEGALTEVLVIAAGLSIQDPRERPLDRQGAADSAHQRFQDPRSDFLTLLNLWGAFHEQWEALQTQNQLRKFCKSHFLSYVRMREWQDIHAQLAESLRELRHFHFNPQPASPQAIHRAILTGLLGHAAQRAERNLYRISDGRTVMLFPASCLFDRTPAKKKKGAKRDQQSDEPEAERSFQPRWLMAGEIVETSRLYARTAAGIDPQWIVELGAHLCSSSFRDPHWNSREGRVMVRERVALGGLELAERRVPYGRIDPKGATEIFIRHALVAGDLQGRPAFLDHNRKVREKIENWQTRVRHHALSDLDERLYQFYSARLGEVSSSAELDRLLRERRPADPQFLFVSEHDLVPGLDLSYSQQAFPDQVQVGEEAIPVRYAYRPGEERDGVTLVVPARLVLLAEGLPLVWSIPGLREPLVLDLLRALPKALRRQLMPIAAKAEEIARDFRPSDGGLAEQLSRFVRDRFGIAIAPDAWSWNEVPPYLRPRFEVTGTDRKVVGSGRDLTELRTQLEKREASAADEVWRRAGERWEQFGLRSWSFGDLPERIEISQVAGVPVFAYPGLSAEGDEVSLRLFRKKDEAEQESRGGIRVLGERVLQRELGWLRKDLRALGGLGPQVITLTQPERLEAEGYRGALDHLFHLEPVLPLQAARFEAMLAHARERLRGLGQRIIDLTRETLTLRQSILLHLSRKPVPAVEQHLADLMPPDFLSRIPWERLQHLPRYLKALRIRAERAAVNPVKDREKSGRVAPYVELCRRLSRCSAQPDVPADVVRQFEDFRWLVEEYRVSCFAQEVGTAQPVSSRRLDEQGALLEQRIPRGTGSG